MKLNRKWLMVIALVMSLTMATAGTLAYLTDRDTEVNTFTMGNVDIEVEEEYEPNSPLLPGVKVDKKAGIENVHETSDAWVWMTVSVPEKLNPYIELGWLEGTPTPIKLEGTPVKAGYVSYLVKHTAKLEAGASTPKYLQSVTLVPSVDYQDGEYVAVVNGEKVPIGDLSTVDIIVDGYAMQTTNIGSVDAAFNAYYAQWNGLTGGDSGANGGEEDDEPTLPTTKWIDAADTAWYDADPTATSFEIDTAEELAGLAKLVNEAGMNAHFLADKTVKLTEDIDLDGKLWTPIGVVNTSPFWGTFDGNNHTISNVIVNEPTMEGAGLFGAIFYGGDWAKNIATVQKLNVENATIVAKECAAAVVGHSYGSVNECKVTNATITVAEGKAGGIVGSTTADSTKISISNNEAKNITVTNAEGNNEVGGIAGRIWKNLCTFNANTFETASVNGTALDKAIGIEY